mgnify:CR=1 FL=1
MQRDRSSVAPCSTGARLTSQQQLSPQPAVSKNHVLSTGDQARGRAGGRQSILSARNLESLQFLNITKISHIRRMLQILANW